MTDARWADARNVLCVRLDNMGDVLMCTPAMRALRASSPDRRITLLASGSGAAVARFVPEIDEVLAYAAPWVKISQPHDAAVDLAMVETLRERAFDAAVIFTTYSQSPLPAAMLCYLAGIPLRLAHCRENPYRMLTDWLVESEPERQLRHEVRRQLDLVVHIGCHAEDEHLSFAIRDADRAWMRQRLMRGGIAPDRRWILLHPGATAPSRRYPATHWSRVVAQLATEGFAIVCTGGAGERTLIESIIAPVMSSTSHAAGAPPILSLAGELDLGQLGAAIAMASVFVCNNTGPAHMAAATGTPLVDLYALTNPQHMPWQVAHRTLYHDVDCKYCYKSICPQQHNDCLRKVTPAQVIDAVHDLLAERAVESRKPAGRRLMLAAAG